MPIVKTGTVADWQQDIYGLGKESDKNLKSKQLYVELMKGGMPPRNKKNFRSTKSGAGMTQAGVKAYRRMNPGSKLSTAVTEDNPGPKRSARRKSYCARSAGQMKMFPNAAKDPNSRLRQARRRWKCYLAMSYLNANIPPIYC